jgi:hypothetical protein
MTGLGNRWRYISQHGLIAAAHAFFDRYVYSSQQYVITHSALAGPPAVDHVEDVVFRTATPSDLDRLDEFERYDRYRRGTRQRAYVENNNDWLFVACHENRIVAIRRVSRLVRDPLMSRVIRLGPSQVWMADVFCLPEYRSRGIARHLQLFGDRVLASQGYTERFASIAVKNTASLRMARGSGSQRLYYVSYVRFLFYEHLRVLRETPHQFDEASTST